MRYMDCKAGEQDQVQALLGELRRFSEAEAGCLSFQVSKSVDDPRTFLLFEVYKNAKAVQAHNESKHFQRLVMGVANPLLESRERRVYELLE